MKKEETRYYVTSGEDIGPSDAQEKIYYISTAAPRTNLGGTIVTAGWLGTTDDVAAYAHGAYDTLEEARRHIFSELADIGYREADDVMIYGDLVEAYLAHALPAASAEGTIEYSYEAIREDVTATSTDDDIEDLIHALCAEAEGARLDRGALRDAIWEYRDSLR